MIDQEALDELRAEEIAAMDDDYKWHRIDVKTCKVDGRDVKADVFYVLKDGIFTEYNDN